MDNSVVSRFRHCRSLVPAFYEEHYLCSANHWQHGLISTLQLLDTNLPDTPLVPPAEETKRRDLKFIVCKFAIALGLRPRFINRGLFPSQRDIPSQKTLMFSNSREVLLNNSLMNNIKNTYVLLL